MHAPSDNTHERSFLLALSHAHAQAWINEKCAPDLLFYQDRLVESAKRKMRKHVTPSSARPSLRPACAPLAATGTDKGSEAETRSAAASCWAPEVMLMVCAGGCLGAAAS